MRRKHRIAALLLSAVLLVCLLPVGASAAVNYGTVSAASETELNQALYTVGNYYNLTVNLTADTELTADFTVPASPCKVTIAVQSGVTLTVGSGVTLTNEGIITVASGAALTVADGGTLKNTGSIKLQGGSMQVNGSYSGASGTPNVIWDASRYATGTAGDWCSLSLDNVCITVEAESQQEFEDAFDLEYTWLEINLWSSAEFNENTVIPAGHTVVLWFDSTTFEAATLRIPSGITVTNNGTLNIIDPSILQIDGRLVNNGTVKVGGSLTAAAWNSVTGTGTITGSGTVSIPEKPRGDANGDDSIDGTDLVLLTRALAGITAETVSDEADMDGSGTLDSADIALLAAYLNR